MKKETLSICVFLILTILGCKNSQNIDFEADKAAILSADTEFSNAVSAENIGTLGQLIDEDAVFVLNGGNSLKGKGAVIKRYQGLFSDSSILSITRKPIESVVFESGNLGYSFGDWENISINATGEKYNTDGSYLFIWKRHEDGKWKVLIIKI